MKFIALFNLKEGVTQAKVLETIARRAEYKMPEGIHLLAEYWTSSAAPAAISVIEADDPAPLMLNSVAWLDTFNVTVLPVTEWQEGVKKFGKTAGRK